MGLKQDTFMLNYLIYSISCSLFTFYCLRYCELRYIVHSVERLIAQLRNASCLRPCLRLKILSFLDQLLGCTENQFSNTNILQNTARLVPVDRRVSDGSRE